MTTKADRMSQPRDYEIIVENDVKIPLRDGTLLSADVRRPDGGDERFPAIMSLTQYQKDKVWTPPADLEEPPGPLPARGDDQRSRHQAPEIEGEEIGERLLGQGPRW